jgi:alkanesulfonate monooxygenase SsuD/methylene tetrahydromethanopterin reductase-like flavin-dependent oxidoreductase (luciferase family)
VTDNDISFGLIFTPAGTGREWVEAVRKVEQQGWTSLLIPDTLWTPSPFPALAAAAAATTTLRLRTWVIAAPLRSPTVVAREASTLQQLSDGRFELGIGSGRPDAEQEAELLGVLWGTAADRIGQVQQVITTVRE